ncbi:MAG: hypothetical protein JSW23_05130, partial [Planctomycetota bacterium]
MRELAGRHAHTDRPGFDDIAANPDSWGGQVLLMVQVILGYVLLGALVTRFAVLFTAGGPA